MRTIRKIIIHHSASPRSTTTVKDIREWHITAPPVGNGWPHIGYHRVIDKDGIISHTLLPSMIGYGVWGKNENSIHICVIGNFEKEFPTEQQLNALKNECYQLCRRFGLKSWDISYHKIEAMQGHETLCPGKYLIDKINKLCFEVGELLKIDDHVKFPTCLVSKEKNQTISIMEEIINIVKKFLLLFKRG